MIESEQKPASTELLFLSVYCNPGLGEEWLWVDYYSRGQTEQQRLRQDLAKHIASQLHLMSEAYGFEDNFSLAEYDDPSDELQESEIEVFRSALSPDERDTPFSELHPRDVLDGYRAVMLERLRTGDLNSIHKAIDLFNRTIESGLMCVPNSSYENPCSWLILDPPQKFACWLIDALLACANGWPGPRRYYWPFLGEKLQAMKPWLEMLQPIVTREGWPQSDLMLGRFLLLFDFYKSMTEEIF